VASRIRAREKGDLIAKGHRILSLIFRAQHLVALYRKLKHNCQLTMGLDTISAVHFAASRCIEFRAKVAPKVALRTSANMAALRSRVQSQSLAPTC
jgi:hypothetical protein